MQASPQAVRQHTPSTQKPLMHAPSPAQGCPVVRRQRALASHPKAPSQLPRSWSRRTGAQTPNRPGNAQLSQSPSQASSQHRSSRQSSLRHSTSARQGAASSSLHTPAASQRRSPAQVSASSPETTGTQRPAAPGVAQVRQEPAQLSSQQKPSAQRPLVHASSAIQGVPISSVGTHAPRRQ